MRRYGRGSQVAAVLIVITGVALLATLAFLVSYPGARQIALTAGVSPALAGLYPVIIDAVLVVACVAALALRGGSGATHAQGVLLLIEQHTGLPRLDAGLCK